MGEVARPAEQPEHAEEQRQRHPEHVEHRLPVGRGEHDETGGEGHGDDEKPGGVGVGHERCRHAEVRVDARESERQSDEQPVESAQGA